MDQVVIRKTQEQVMLREADLRRVVGASSVNSELFPSG